jgi:acetyl esterase/lipase
VVGSGAAAVYVDYTPSPEAQFPTAINQAYAATRWVAEHGKEIGVDGSAWRWPATASAATWLRWWR